MRRGALAFPPAAAFARWLAAAKLQQAVDYAKDQVRTFGAVLGPLPDKRAGANGVILRHARFGDSRANDPVDSVANWHWYQSQAMAGMVERIVAAVMSR